MIGRHFRLTLEEDALLASAAKKDGRSKNGTLRALIRTLAVPAPPDRPMADVIRDVRRAYRGKGHA